MAERETGYYWVKFDLSDEEWVIAHYTAEYKEWYVTGNDSTFTSKDFDIINEEKIVRQNGK